MQDNKNKNKEKLTPKKLTKIFSLIWFGLVFVFTFCLISKEIKDNKTNLIITASVIFGVLFISIIVWLILFLLLKKKSKTDNDRKIEQALKIAQAEAKEEFKKKQEEWKKDK